MADPTFDAAPTPPVPPPPGTVTAPVAAPSALALFLAAIPVGKVQRAVAALVAFVLPFAAGVARSKFGIEVSDAALLAAEGTLTVYIGQSVVNEIHARSTDAGAGA